MTSRPDPAVHDAAGVAEDRRQNGRVPVVLLGGLENSLSVGRCLGAQGIPVHFIGDRWAALRFSRYCTRFTEAGPGDATRYLEPLERHGPGSGVVIPCGDDGLEFVAKHRRTIADMGYTAIEANDEALLAMLDKEAAYTIARGHDVRSPRTVPVSDIGELRAAVETIGLPAAIKPRVSHAFARHFTGKAIVVNEFAAAENAFQKLAARGIDVVLTEIIPGPEGTYWGYYTYIVESGTRLFEFTKRKLRQYPLGFGLGTLHRMEVNKAVFEVGRRFVKAAELRGLVNVEFKQDERDGGYVFIECNHRITAANELMVAAGIDLGSFVYERLTGAAPEPVEQRRDDVLLWWPVRDTSAAIEMLLARRLTLRQWWRGLRGRILLPGFRFTDPLPSAASFVRSVVRLPRRLFRLVRRSVR
jgi:predicted ATP-grasp superfamily ATP-dependent carboligase